MKQRATDAFRDERGRYRLRFTCEHCTYFRTEDERCMHGYPNEAHREARYQGAADELTFCKEFELM